MSCITAKEMTAGTNVVYTRHGRILSYYYRKGIVYLHCDEAALNPIINTTGDTETKYLYLFDLYTNEACIPKKHSSGSNDSGYNRHHINLTVSFCHACSLLLPL